jgi:hypothetical protein
MYPRLPSRDFVNDFENGLKNDFENERKSKMRRHLHAYDYSDEVLRYRHISSYFVRPDDSIGLSAEVAILTCNV